jgi:hypothetical protein
LRALGLSLLPLTADPTGLASPSLYFLQILFCSLFSRIFLLK